MKKKIVVLSGAGISAESGVKTFRDSNGLWKNHRIEEVASPIAWQNNPEMVLEFYNIRRKQLFEVEPNAAHYALAELQNMFDVQIITQNVDDLHERAGSKNVLHLHGELKKARSTSDESLVYPLKSWELNLGDKCELGSQLRPHIVWFGEAVKNIEKAVEISESADVFMVIGTSMLVFPAAGLLNFVSRNAPKYYIDPNATKLTSVSNLKIIKEKAGIAVPQVLEELKKQFTTS
ncbi:MAG: NAD-dependent protein deacylase [Marinilabiliales bacterium]|nr:MAG: NAD-dependent protein deacylase [Marinilabiliales bacterium]